MQGMRKPKLFWVSAAAPLVSVILSTLLVTLFRSKLHSIATVRLIAQDYYRLRCFIDTLNCKFYQIFCFLDWSFGKRFESTIIKHALFSWKISWSRYQDWHHNWNIISHRKFHAQLGCTIQLHVTLD